MVRATLLFAASLGLIALAGMIMRNAVIRFDQIETNVAHGLTRHAAIIVLGARPPGVCIVSNGS